MWVLWPGGPLQKSGGEEGGGDGFPLGFERAGEDGLPCPAVPIGGVGRITFFAVQVGVQPISNLALSRVSMACAIS